MHILITANSAWNIVNFRVPVVRALLAGGHDVTVVAPLDDSIMEIERLGCKFVPLTMNVKGLNPVDDLRLLRDLRNVFRSQKPDVVLGYTIKNNIFGALAAKSRGIPFIPNVTGLGTAFLSGGVLQALAERLYRTAFAQLPFVFFQNEDDQALFLQRRLVKPNQARLLPGSGINLSHFSPAAFPPETTPPVFLMIGRVLRDKGVMEFVEAARMVRRSNASATFQLLGAIDAENRTAIGSTTVQGWVEEGVIHYLGTTKDVRPFIAAAQCVVLPSYREGAPRTLIEAASMARPLIATDVPGCRSIIDAGTTGFLCEPRNSNSLAGACMQFLELPHSAKIEMGVAGRAKMEREFDESIIVEAYQNAISQVMRGVVLTSPIH